MKILQITKYYHPATSFGGPVQCTYNISKRLAKKGHEVTVYTTDALEIGKNSNIKDRFTLRDNVRVFFFHNVTKAYGLFISTSMISALRKNQNFDIVHLHEYRTFQNLAFYYSRMRNVPYVLSAHGELASAYFGDRWDFVFLRRLFDDIFGKDLLKGARKLFALNEFEAAQFINAGFDENNVVLIGNGIDPEDFSNPPPQGHFRTLFGVAEENIILYLGRIHRRKGIDVLVKAVSFLSNDKNNIKLVIAGPDDGFLKPLKRMVTRLKLEERVLFTGTLTREQVLAAYNDASVVVYPSIQEGFPIVPLEAGIMVKPIVVSNDPSMDFVKKGGSGLIVDKGNAVQLREALQDILEDHALARTLGRNGRKFVLDNFTWDAITEKIEKTYFQILEQ